MREGWKEVRLADYYSISSGLSKSAEEFGSGFPFVSFKNVFWNFFLPKQLTELVNTTERERKTCSVKYGDVFLTRTSEKVEELGMSSVALQDYPDATFNGFTKRLRPLNDIDIEPIFIGFYLRSPQFRAEITAYSSLTTRASLNNDIIGRLKILLPPLPTQRKIASILSAYDDLIENNLKRINLLEEKAQLTYEEWFVRMKFSGHDTAVFDEESGLPEGWEKKTLRDLSKRITKGTTPTSLKKQFTETGINFIKAESYADDGFFKREKFAFIDEETNQILKRSQLKENDIIVSIAGVLGRVALISKEVLPANTNQAVGIISLDQSLISPYHIKYFLSSEYMNKLINVISGQAAQPNINLAQLGSFNVSVPSKEITFRFQNLIEPIFKTQQCLVSQNQLLKEARDILLPRLMIGMVDVDEIVGTSVEDKGVKLETL